MWPLRKNLGFSASMPTYFIAMLVFISAYFYENWKMRSRLERLLKQDDTLYNWLDLLQKIQASSIRLAMLIRDLFNGQLLPSSQKLSTLGNLIYFSCVNIAKEGILEQLRATEDGRKLMFIVVQRPDYLSKAVLKDIDAAIDAMGLKQVFILSSLPTTTEQPVKDWVKNSLAARKQLRL